MAIPYDFNPVGKAAGSKSKAKTSTIWEITTTGANNTYGFKLSDYQGETNIIDWGDGTIAQSSSNTNYTGYTHTYTNAGTYTISVLGNHTNIQLGDRENTSYGKYVSKVIQLCDSITSYDYLFSCCTNLTTQMLPEDLTVPEGITITRAMFRQTKITSLPDGFTIPNSVTNCDGVFYKCSTLISLPKGFIIPNFVTDCHNMFYQCSNLTSLPDGFTIPNSVTDCTYMFYQCSNLTSLPEGFTISNSVTNCINMFYQCSNLTSLPDGFTIPNSVTNCSNMFYYCKNLTSLPEGFTIPNSVTSCQNMFNYCQKLVYDISILLSKWTAKTRNVNACFCYCRKITGQAPANVLWNVQSITSYSNCFTSCTSLSNYYSIPFSWGGGAVQMADQKFVVINSNQEIQLVATGGGTLTFTSDDLPEGVILSSDGILTNFTADGIYTFTVKCSSSYGVEDSAEITVKVDLYLVKTQNNLTSDQSNQNFYVSQRDTRGSYNAWKAMDGNNSTYSRTQDSSGQTDWWQIEFVSPVILSQIYLKMDNQSSTQSYLQASNDGSNWVNLMTSTIADPFDGFIQLNLEMPYKYYRFLANRTNYYIQIYEVVFYYKFAENYLSAKDQTINAQLGEQFTYQIEYQNYSETPVQFYIDSELPEGIYFDETTGTFSGSSSVQITEYLSVRLTNTYKTISIMITLNVIDGTSIVPDGLTYWQPFDTSYITPKIGNDMTLYDENDQPILEEIDGLTCVSFTGTQALYDNNADYWTPPAGTHCANITFSLWVYVPTVVTARTVAFQIGKNFKQFTTGPGILVYLQTNGTISVDYAGHYNVNLGTCSLGQWHHVAANTKYTTTSTMRTFFDGVYKGGQNRSYKQLAAPWLSIGCRIEDESLSQLYIDSGTFSITNIRVYDRTLTDEQIVTIYQQERKQISS